MMHAEAAFVGVGVEHAGDVVKLFVAGGSGVWNDAHMGVHAELTP